MKLPDGLTENFRFIIAESKAQLQRTLLFVGAPNRDGYEKIYTKEGYINNLKAIIENEAYAALQLTKYKEKKQVNTIRAILGVTANLERVCDICINIVEQIGYLKHRNVLRRSEYDPLFQIIQENIDRIEVAFDNRSLPVALRICRGEHVIDALYKNILDRLTGDLNKGGQDAGDIITIIFIYRYLERIGDHLLNIGEVLILAILGHRIKIEQFDSLQRTLERSGYLGSVEDIDYQAIWGSRSGCNIGKLVSPETNGGEEQGTIHGSLFKEGARTKIIKEKENIEKWASFFPCLVPRIFGYNEEDDKASLLIEFMPGQTFDEIVFSPDKSMLEDASTLLMKTLGNIWQTTIQYTPASTDYINQLQKRLEDIRQVHPHFLRPSFAIGKRNLPSIETLIANCQKAEHSLSMPFTVLIHGDFNTNNIMYTPQEQQVRFIDLYRSRQYDYLQDISVFLVSNFRQPVFDTAQRQRLNAVIEQFTDFTLQFAEEMNDTTAQARLAFALARSFFTSTRFELNSKFANEMFIRAIFLFERIHSHSMQTNSWEGFVFPKETLNY